MGACGLSLDAETRRRGERSGEAGREREGSGFTVSAEWRAETAEKESELGLDWQAEARPTENTAFQEKLKGMPDRLRHLQATLDMNFDRAKRYFPPEDQELAELHGEVSRALWPTPPKPVDLDAAAILLKRYVAGIDRRIDDLGRASGGEEPDR